MDGWFGRSRRELCALCEAEGFGRYRGNQLADWLYRRLVTDPAVMTNLPGPLRTALQKFPPPVSTVKESRSADDTVKLLLRLADDELIEMVLIPSEKRMTFCLSTQVGCPVGCRFCASGRNGLTRNLKSGEILGELLAGCALHGSLPDNVVFMGIGEGLLNFQELSAALERMTSPEEFGMSPRRITVSTSGYVPGILKLAELGREYTLAISLHAPDDALRKTLIPDPLRYPVAEILAAADVYREKAGRLVTLEYTMLRDVNDSISCADALARLAREHHTKVNLIAYNETGGEFRCSTQESIRAFSRRLENAGVTVTLRRSKGASSDAACGQLRASSL